VIHGQHLVKEPTALNGTQRHQWEIGFDRDLHRCRSQRRDDIFDAEEVRGSNPQAPTEARPSEQRSSRRPLSCFQGRNPALANRASASGGRSAHEHVIAVDPALDRSGRQEARLTAAEVVDVRAGATLGSGIEEGNSPAIW
jgi:hypothetical protein